LCTRSAAQRRARAATAIATTPTSYELISSALAAGQIDAETAHRYRVFAAFTDTRLPQQYRGDDSTIEEVPASVAEAGTLSGTHLNTQFGSAITTYHRYSFRCAGC
jgi:hypothetical protein